ncbi:MAG: S24/S26 family peptidase [Coraliomargarita sp.]
MKTTAVITLAIFTAFLTAFASPKSSASFEKALSDAEMVASLNPDWSVHRTKGNSMGDFFGNNSLIVVQKAGIENIRTGMMIVYRSKQGELVSHKVMQHNGDSLRTQGTANWSLDPEPVTDDMIVGAIFCVFHANSAPFGTTFASNGQPLPVATCKTF